MPVQGRLSAASGRLLTGRIQSASLKGEPALKSRLQIVLLSLVIAVVAASGIAYGFLAPATSAAPPVRGLDTGFTTVKTTTFTPVEGGPAVLRAVSVRYQQKSGDWKNVQTSFSPTGVITAVAISIGRVGKGVFVVNPKEKTLDYLSEFEAREQITASDLRNSPQFARADSVLGYKTFVQRLTREGNYSIDYYVSPDLLGTTVKKVEVYEKGAEVEELVNVIPGDHTGLFDVVDTFAVKYDLLREKIRALEGSGRIELADHFKTVLAAKDRARKE